MESGKRSLKVSRQGRKDFAKDADAGKASNFMRQAPSTKKERKRVESGESKWILKVSPNDAKFGQRAQMGLENLNFKF